MWKGDDFCASASRPREEVLREAIHYATQYEQEGPVQIFEVIRRPVDAAMLKEGKE